MTSRFRGQREEEKSRKETEKKQLVRQMEHQKSTVFWKTSEESVLRRRTWSTVLDAPD